MSNVIHSNGREAVRVKVKKCESNNSAEWRKFSIDPQITTLDMLCTLLAKAFDVRSNFSIKYKAYDPAGNEVYLPVLSDGDLDAAFLRIHNVAIQTSTEPSLVLQMHVKPSDDTESSILKSETSPLVPLEQKSTLADSALTPITVTAKDFMSPLQQSLGASQKYMQHMQNRLPGLIMNHMEKTFSMVQKAFNLSEETMAALPPRPPLSDNEFRSFLDALGQVQRKDELRKVIFFGGIDPSLRRVVWKHILDVYPCGMNGNQRMDYMRKKSEDYIQLREVWKTAIKQGVVVGELAYVTSMVRKDVLRTDRLLPFYSGSDDNQNITSLFNILTTYALNHPTVSYCQGMSDIASPLLVTMNDEAQAYICFCAIMKRMRGNFMLDGIAMTQKFAHLTEALSYYDPEFWEYLKGQQADDLLFCYRWLLLEMKREFPFEDALHMLEVQWSSLKYDTNRTEELKLFEVRFEPFELETVTTTATTITNTTSSSEVANNVNNITTSNALSTYFLTHLRENAYSNVCALRRQSSTLSLNSVRNHLGSVLNDTKGINLSLDDSITSYASRRHRRTASKAHCSLDEAKIHKLMENSKNSEISKQLTRNQQNQSIGDELIQPNETHKDVEDDINSSIETKNVEILRNTNEIFHVGDHIEFEDTNPFKFDAYCNDVTVTTARLSNRSKVFLSSSSSSAGSETSSDDSLHSNNRMETHPMLATCSDDLVPPHCVPQSIAKLQNQNILSNYTAVTHIIAKRFGHHNDNYTGNHYRQFKVNPPASSNKDNEIIDNNKDDLKTLKKVSNTLNGFVCFNGNNGKLNSYAHQQPTLMERINSQSACTYPLVQLSKEDICSSLESEAETMPLLDKALQTDALTQIKANVSKASNIHKDIEFQSLDKQFSEYTAIDGENVKKSNANLLNIKEDNSSQAPKERNLNPFLDDSLLANDIAENAILTTTNDINDILMSQSTVETDTITPIEIATTAAELDADINTLINATRCAINKSESSSLSSSSSSLLTPPTAPTKCRAADTTTTTTAATTAAASAALSSITGLPAANEFGGGNPFLMFLCLTLLLQHRETIMRSNMDYNEIAMHFDKMVRKHNVTRVLNQARRMYIDYLKMQQQLFRLQHATKLK